MFRKNNDQRSSFNKTSRYIDGQNQNKWTNDLILYTIGLDSCLGKLMVDLVGISRVSRDLPITKCLIPGVPDNLTLGHIPA